MALTSYGDYSTWYGATPPGTIAQYAVLIAEVDRAIKDHCRSNIEEATYSNMTLTAPASSQLVLPEGPVRNSNLSISFNPQAYGNTSQFTANDVLTQYSAWMLQVDGKDSGNSTSKVVLRIGQPWSSATAAPYLRLAPVWGPIPGSLLVTFTAGYATVPASVSAAANLMVSMLFQRRVMGYPVASESRGAWSVSFGGPATAAAMTNEPTIASLLEPYCAFDRKIGWGK